MERHLIHGTVGQDYVHGRNSWIFSEAEVLQDVEYLDALQIEVGSSHAHTANRILDLCTKRDTNSITTKMKYQYNSKNNKTKST